MNRELSGRRITRIDKMLQKCDKLTNKNYGAYIKELRNNTRQTNHVARKLCLSIDVLADDTSTTLSSAAMS